jgi:hypothetical protein
MTTDERWDNRGATCNIVAILFNKIPLFLQTHKLGLANAYAVQKELMLQVTAGRFI